MFIFRAWSENPLRSPSSHLCICKWISFCIPMKRGGQLNARTRNSRLCLEPARCARVARQDRSRDCGAPGQRMLSLLKSCSLELPNSTNNRHGLVQHSCAALEIRLSLHFNFTARGHDLSSAVYPAAFGPKQRSKQDMLEPDACDNMHPKCQLPASELSLYELAMIPQQMHSRAMPCPWPLSHHMRPTSSRVSLGTYLLHLLKVTFCLYHAPMSMCKAGAMCSRRPRLLDRHKVRKHSSVSMDAERAAQYKEAQVGAAPLTWKATKPQLSAAFMPRRPSGWSS